MIYLETCIVTDQCLYFLGFCLIAFAWNRIKYIIAHRSVYTGKMP